MRRYAVLEVDLLRGKIIRRNVCTASGISRLVGGILSTDRAEPCTTSRLSSSAWTHSLFFAYICKAGEHRTSATSMPQPPE